MNVTLGILAHVDAGKTTLSEQMLYRCGVLRACGRVDRGDACLDFAPVERRRGITVFSAQAQFRHGENQYFLLDTPGHADFSPEMERCLAAMDLSILVVSAAGGVEVGTERIWRLLQERGLPAVCFLNKSDCPGAEPDAVFRQLEQRLGGPFCDLRRGMNEAVREQIAMTDDAALEACLDGTLTDGEAWEFLADAVAKRKLFPVFGGSALTGEGVEALLEGLDLLCRTEYNADGPLEVLAYQIRHDRQGGRVVYGKVLSGTLRPRQMLHGEKVNELRRYLGEKWTPLPSASAGELAALTGLRAIRAGDRAGETLYEQSETAVPPLLAEVHGGPETPPQRLLECFRQLEDEEPALSVCWNEALQQLQVAVMGDVQLEILQQTVQERFGLPVSFGECQAVYRETIAAPVRGCGHFEPLRHYAEVHLLLEPGPRGSGVTFDSRCPTDVLAGSWQRLIRTHVLERRHAGALTGMALTDVRVVLLAGRAHEKHTEGGDFRQAVYRAIRQALFHADNVLLEPYYRFVMEVPPEIAGRILADLAQLHGVCAPPDPLGERVRLTGRCPVAAMLPYSRGFASLTRGRGTLRLEPDGYEPCVNTEEVVRRLGYDRERDTENPADSVFCDHGAGHTVKWYDAPAHMHLVLD